MEKQQAKGELGEAELRALEMDVTGKVRLTFISSLSHCNNVLRIRSCLRHGVARAWRLFRFYER